VEDLFELPEWCQLDTLFKHLCGRTLRPVLFPLFHWFFTDSQKEHRCNMVMRRIVWPLLFGDHWTNLQPDDLCWANLHSFETSATPPVARMAAMFLRPILQGMPQPNAARFVHTMGIPSCSLCAVHLCWTFFTTDTSNTYFQHDPAEAVTHPTPAVLVDDQHMMPLTHMLSIMACAQDMVEDIPELVEAAKLLTTGHTWANKVCTGPARLGTDI
jgi:hypothetical protein